MAKIAVNSEVLEAKAESLTTIATQISTLTNEMKNEISKLKTAWEGEAAETLVNKFMSLSGTFEERYQTINQYSTFLHNAADGMRQTEQTIKEGVNAQPGVK